MASYLDKTGLTTLWSKVKSHVSSNYLALSGGTLTGPITISYTSSATMDYSTTNPRIVFAENGAQPVGLVYSDYNTYRAPFGLKVLSLENTSNKAWFEVEGDIYAGGQVILTGAGNYFRSYNDDGSASVRFGYGSGNTNHGIYSDALGSWVMYADGTHTYVPDWASIGSSTKPIYFNSNGFPVACGSSLAVSITGNAATATALATGRTLKVNLASTSASTAFDGSANIANIGVSGTLPIANGGTGATDAATARTNLGVTSTNINKKTWATNANMGTLSAGIYISELPSTAVSASDPTYGAMLTAFWSMDQGFQLGGGKGNKTLAFRYCDSNAVNSDGVEDVSDWYSFYHTGNKPTASELGVLPLSGGALTGQLTLVGEQYNYPTDAASYALNCNNSNIIKVNGIYTADAANNFQEAFCFYRDGSIWDKFTAASGKFYFGAGLGADNSTLLGSAHLYAKGYWVQDGTNTTRYADLYTETVGTTSTGGVGRLTLGNNTATGTAGNSKGRLVFYGPNTYYADITYSGSKSRTINLAEVPVATWTSSTSTLTFLM